MGFDNECILNIQSLAGEYFCPVCRLLVYPNEAIQTQCTHLYCKPCLTYIVSTTRACPYDGYLVTEADSKPLLESNKPLAETISKIAVHCLYHRSGCTWQGPLSECTSHCSGCAFGNSPVVCNRCGIQIVHREVQEHAQNCSSVQLQAQQSEGASGVGASGTAVTGANQNQVVVQAGPTSTQTPASQAGAAQDASQHANANTPAVAQASASVPAPEQWYQQHQQYQQYYQQYPGYDPYQQQYLHYYPYQQQPVQQYQQQPLQAQPSLVPGQNQGQVYAQPVVQPQPLPQAQSIPQPNSQPPDQPLINTQLQPQLHAQASVAPQNQSQMQVNLQKQMQVPPQAHPPAHCQPLSHPQPYLQAQPYPPTLHSQIPQNQQPHPQMQYPQPQAQISTHPQHPQNQPFPQPLPHSQPPSQVLLQHHLVHPHPRPPVQPSQTPIANSVFQAPHSSAPAVSGLQSYAQSHSYLQMSAGVPQHQPTNMSIQSGPHQQSQNPAQISGQLPQPPQMRLPQSHPPMANQQLTSLPPHVQGSIVPSVQQHPFYPQTQQPDYPVQQQQPFTQAMQQAMPQYVQQQHQGYLGQPSGMVQKGTFPQQQQQQQPIQTASRPQGPPQALQQPSTVSQFPQQNVALSNVMVSQYQPNHAVRPMMPNQGLQSQPSSQSHGGGVVQSRPLQPSSTQLSTIQNYSSKVNSQLQPPSEHHHAAIQQSEAPLKSMMLDRQNNPNNESSGVEQEAALQKSGLKDASGVEAEMKHIQSESDSKLVAHGQQHTAVDSQAGISTKDIPEPACTESGVPETGVTENGSIYPSIKQMKQETATNAFETSSTGKSVEIVEENKDASGLDHKQAEVASFEEKEIQEVREHESDKLQIVTSVDGGLVQPLIRNTRGSEVVPGPASASSTSIQNVFPKDQIIGSESDNIQLHEKDFSRPSHPVPYTDQGRLMLPPTHYGPSHYQQRPDALASLQSLPPQGPSHLVQAPPPRPRVPGPSPHSGQPLTAPEHFQAHMLKQPHGSFHSDGPPGAVLGGASAAPFGMGPSHFDPYQKNFEHHPTAHVHYEQGHVPIGIPKASSGSFDSAAGLTTRVPTQPGPSGRVGSEFISNQRSGYHEQGPIGHHPDVQSKLFKMDAPPFFDSASAFGLRNERFKPMREEHTTPLPMEPPRHAVDRGEFDDLRRPPNLDGGLFPKTGSYNSFSRPFDAIPHNAAPRPLDKGPHGYNYDELGSNKSIGHPRFLPPYHHNDINGRASHPFARTDFLGQALGFVQHHMDVRSPPKEFPVIPPRGFGGFPGAPGNLSGLDGIEGRESQPLGDGSKSFDLSSNSMMNPFHEGRYPVLPSRLHRGDIDLPGHLRLGEPPVGFAGGPGNFLPRPRPGEPGFRSSYSQHGYSTDGFYTGAMESFDNTRKTKQASMGWCRICKVDCETVEGLDLHSQTREHQKIAMDIVLSIKQQNRKKHKTSNDHSSLEEASKPRNVPLDGRGNKH